MPLPARYTHYVYMAYLTGRCVYRVAKIDEAKRTKSSLGIVSMEAEDGAHPLNRSDSV